MICRVYRSSIFSRVLYSMLAVGIILPGTCIMFYGLEKRYMDFPMFIIGALFISYVIFLLQKLFIYRVVMHDDYMEIYTPGESVSIRYEDILDIQFKRNACYIIDRTCVDGEYYIRGTDKSIKESIGHIEIDIRKIPAVQRPFLQGYDSIVEYIVYKCSAMEKNIGHLKYRNGPGMSPLISAALMKDIGEDRTGILESFKVLWPHFLMLLIILMSMIVVVVIGRGNYPDYFVRYVKLIFPLSAVIITYVLSLKYIHYMKSILGMEKSEMEVPRKNIIIYLICNIIVSYCVIALFFHLLSRIIL